MFLFFVAEFVVGFAAGCVFAAYLLQRRRLRQTRGVQTPGIECPPRHVAVYVPFEVWKRLEFQIAKGGASKVQVVQALFWFASRMSGTEQADLVWKWCREHETD